MLATIAFVATLILVGFPLLFIRRELPGLRISRAAISRDSLKGLLGFSWFAFLGHIAGKVVFSADVIVIGIILGAKEVALYGVASRLFGFAAGVASTGTSLLLPLQSELEGRGEHERQRLFVTAGVRASASVGVLLGFPLIILPAWVLTAWLGTGFDASVAPLALLGAAAVFTSTNVVLSQYLFARGRPALLAGGPVVPGGGEPRAYDRPAARDRRDLGRRPRNARRRGHFGDHRASSPRAQARRLASAR